MNSCCSSWVENQLVEQCFDTSPVPGKNLVCILARQCHKNVLNRLSLFVSGKTPLLKLTECSLEIGNEGRTPTHIDLTFQDNTTALYNVNLPETFLVNGAIAFPEDKLLSFSMSIDASSVFDDLQLIESLCHSDSENIQLNDSLSVDIVFPANKDRFKITPIDSCGKPVHLPAYSPVTFMCGGIHINQPLPLCMYVDPSSLPYIFEFPKLRDETQQREMSQKCRIEAGPAADVKSFVVQFIS